MSKIKNRHPIQYNGNIVFFILWILLFPPVGIILAIKNLIFLKNGKYLGLSYRGSYNWLIFWAVIFFPIAFILLLIKGVDVVEGNVLL